uniref:U55-Eretoxin-Ek1a_1 n=1 Tax=Eresus cinnaberinus TaxID=175337 RepID=A0A2D0PD67_ERECI
MLFWVFLVASALAVAYSEDDGQDTEIVMNVKDVEAIQKKLDKLDFLEKFLSSSIPLGAAQTEQRADKCIPIGGECAFWTGPNCCGLRTRCHVMGRKVSAMTRTNPPYIKCM